MQRQKPVKRTDDKARQSGGLKVLSQQGRYAEGKTAQHQADNKQPGGTHSSVKRFWQYTPREVRQSQRQNSSACPRIK